MYNSINFLNIRSHRASVYVRRNKPSRPIYFRVPCKLCEDRESERGQHTVQNGCQVCNGSGSLTLEGSSDNYETCGTCLGTGKDPDVRFSQPCRICKGSGMVQAIWMDR
jgi:DnaJ-class molecular chaperone